MKTRSIHQNTHPFGAWPFEAFYNGSWKTVECLRIRAGAKTMILVDDGAVFEENVPITNLRIRSRKATSSDCTCFLRPGLDVCVLSTCELAESSGEDENMGPVWLDAKIDSIQRKPHESSCACQFYVSFYITQGPLGITKETLRKDTTMVQIDQIFILQNLKRNPCENEHYRWDFSEDCSSLQKCKLFPGKFSSDVSWLLVASVKKKIEIGVRSIQNRIVYQILNDDDGKCSPNSEGNSNAVNFKLEDGISVPIIIPFTPREGTGCDMHEEEPLSFYELMGLRRSKRRCLQPDLYSGCGDLLDLDIDVARVRICKTYGREYEEMTLPRRVQADHPCYSDEHSECGERVHSSKRDFLSSEGKRKSREMKAVVSDRKEHQPPPVYQRKLQSQPPIIPVSGEMDPMVREEDPFDTHIPGSFSREAGEIGSGYIQMNGNPEAHGNINSLVDFSDGEGEWERKGSHKKFQRRRDYSLGLERKSCRNAITYGKRSVSSRMCSETIKRYMENIKSSVNKEQPLAIDQWNEFRAANFLNGGDGCDTPSANEEEDPEIELLWKQMELCMASTHLLEDTEGSNVEDPAEDAKDRCKQRGQVCRHEYILNEEIGILCQWCGYVYTEIKDVSPTFWQCTNWIPNKEPRNQENSEQKNEDVGLFDLFHTPAASNMPLSEEEDNVWVLIPDLKRKLHFHQKRAFEFLWRNIAGSLVPALVEQTDKNRGGCVISHSPGAGKTLLIIAFLVSYLKLFPRSRPLVLAPKTTLYTWYKETLKWEIPVPVYQIHGSRTYRGKFLRKELGISPGPGDPKPDRGVMLVLDCMEKIQNWLAQPSVLLMSYSSFMTLTREDSKLAHKQYLGQLLRQCPGILVLDEGHNPRNNKSRLRKTLMQVETRLRILLSGTLFQNNFGEYFNTLTLARPSFLNDVLQKLDPKFRTRKKGGKTHTSVENRARRFFIDKIAKKIDSSIPEERMHGLNILRKLTSGFINVYDGGSSDNLPGLHCYTLMMKSTPCQQVLLTKLQNQKPKYSGFPLELGFLITLVSIHPWLIRTTSAASQYFDEKELEGLKKYKLDLKSGSKVRFVMSLVPQCIMRKEKVLIFCHNIAPINLFVDIFESFYGWRKGKEVLVLHGEMELFERGMVMDKFDEPGGASKVMLASITACGEGISLTAASRVILLDSEWNPSKTKQAIARVFRPGQAKVVYAYQLLASGTLEEDKYSRTTWKERVSSMIFNEELVEDPSRWQADKIEDDILREIVEEDRATLFHMILKNEKASNVVVRGK